MNRKITINKFWEKHQDIIKTSLEDYQRWFENGEDNYKSVSKCLNDLEKLK